MTPAEAITIELLNPPERVHVHEPVPLHLVIRCPEEGNPTELRSIRSLKNEIAELDADLFERDMLILPGEVYRCTIVAYFRVTGITREPLISVYTGRDTAGRNIVVPLPPLRVVPSLLNEVQILADSICTYEAATKLDITLVHQGLTQFDNFRLTLGPTDSLRAGISDQRRQIFAPHEQIKFTTVIQASALELELDAQVNGERVGPVRMHLPVPPVRDVQTTPVFRFLEPKKLTQANVQIRTLDEASDAILPTAGIYTVYGGGARYRVEITPAHPHATAVKLRGVSGTVEVTDMPADPGSWVFQMVVLNNGVLTTPVALHFDVLTPEGPQQGELNLSVRPRSSKLWLVAVTAGAAVTVKGAAAVVPAILSPGDLWNNMGAALMKVDSMWDLLQLLSIFVVRGVLWLVDLVSRPFQDG